jgi:hypothetical protein
MDGPHFWIGRYRAALWQGRFSHFLVVVAAVVFHASCLSSSHERFPTVAAWPFALVRWRLALVVALPFSLIMPLVLGLHLVGARLVIGRSQVLAPESALKPNRRMCLVTAADIHPTTLKLLHTQVYRIRLILPFSTYFRQSRYRNAHHRRHLLVLGIRKRPNCVPRPTDGSFGMQHGKPLAVPVCPQTARPVLSKLVSIHSQTLK